MNMFFTKHVPSNTQQPSISAEVHMAILLVQYNSFLNLPDHMTKFMSKEFKGCAVAGQFACGRTKTAASINCIGSHMKEELVSAMRTEPFSSVSCLMPVIILDCIKCFLLQYVSSIPISIT